MVRSARRRRIAEAPSLDRALTLCLALAGFLATAPAQQNSLFAAAELAQARDRYDEAAAHSLQLAEEASRSDGSDDRLALRAEGAALLALSNHLRRPSGERVADRLLALAQTPLGRSDPAFADAATAFAFFAMRSTADERAPRVCRQLGYIDSVWICGPLENERGSGFAREFDAERMFDPESTHEGKRRQTSWRHLQAVAPLGSIDLGSVLRPADQSACVVAFAVLADTACTVALHLGSAGSFKVRVGSEVVGARDVDRPFRFDQDAVALPLAAGPNLVTVKFCHQEVGAFHVSMRLSALEGGPASGCGATTEMAVMAAAAKAQAPSVTDLPQVLRGASSRYADRAEVQGEDAFYLALIHFRRHADNEAERTDRRLAEQAVATMPGSTAARMLMAKARQRQAKVDAELDENLRRRDYETVLALDPDHVDALTMLARLFMESARLPGQAEPLLRRALAVAPDSIETNITWAQLLAAYDNESLAAAMLAGLVDQTHPEWARMWIAERLIRSSRPKLAQAFYSPCLSSLDDAVLRRCSELQLAVGQVEPALATIARLERLHPLDRSAYHLRATLNEAEGNYDEALQQCSEWLRLCQDDDDMLLVQSRLLALSNRREEEIGALTEALSVNPNLRDEQRYLEHLQADSTPFFVPWQRDAGDLLAVPTPEDAVRGKDPLFYLLRQNVVQAHRNGTTSSYLHLTMRVQTEAGARSLQFFRMPHYPSEQRARLLSCTVHKPDGTVERPRLSGSSVALSSLRPGDVVDIEGRIDDLTPSFFGDYFGLQHFLAAPDGGATHRSELVVLAAPGRSYRYQLSGGAPTPAERTTEDGTRIFEFVADSLPRQAPEPLMPAAKELLPLVRFSTFADWDSFTSWYWDLIRNQIEVTSAMQAKVQEICADCTTSEERLAAIYQFVTTDVRYEAWEFGVHGYKPYSTSVIFDRRHGDCKDKALLLCALLSEVDIEAWPVLIFADPQRSRDDLVLPMVQHFNHCIAWVPEQDGVTGRFLDGTATWHPKDLVPDMDQGASVLVVEQRRAELLEVPVVTADDNMVRTSFLIELDAERGARINMRLQPHGNAAVSVRSSLDMEPARREERMERWLVGDFGPLAIRSIQASDPFALDTPVELTCNFDVDSIGERSAGQWRLPSTFSDNRLAQLTTEPTRRTPLLLGIPNGEHSTVTYTLPAPMRVSSLPQDKIIGTPFGSFSMTWRAEGDRIVVERQLQIERSRIAPEQYAEFREFVEAIRQSDGRVIVVDVNEEVR